MNEKICYLDAEQALTSINVHVSRYECLNFNLWTYCYLYGSFCHCEYQLVASKQARYH